MRLVEGAHPSEDRLTDLAAGLLDTAARAETLAHLRACPDCERRFVDVSGQAERLRTRPRPRYVGGAMVEAAPREPHASLGARLSAAAARRAWWAAAAALALVALLVAPSLIRRPTSDGLDYWLPSDVERALRRAAPPQAEMETLAAATNAYARRDTQRVVELLAGRPIPGSHDHLKLLLASALVWERRYNEARTVLDQLDVVMLPPLTRDRARWIQYVALRRGGDAAAAEEVARELASVPGEFSERARRELARP